MVTKEPGTSEPSSACRAVPSVTACGVREWGEGEGRVSECVSLRLCCALFGLCYHSIDFDNLVPNIHELRGRHAGQKGFDLAAS